MIRKAFILFSLCCAVLCAFVGYLSFQVMQESDKAVGVAVPSSCEAILKSPPVDTSHVKLTEFATGKHVANLDNDGDSQWEALCVPFFPPKRQKVGHAYRAVLVCFKDVPTRDALGALLETGELDVNYWPERQYLDRAIHSQLAQKYTNMDMAKSPIVYYGFDVENPLLGETSLYASAGAGSIAFFLAFVTLVFGLFQPKKPDALDLNSVDEPTTNRAGLPVGGTPSMLGQVTSSRSVLTN